MTAPPTATDYSGHHKGPWPRRVPRRFSGLLMLTGVDAHVDSGSPMLVDADAVLMARRVVVSELLCTIITVAGVGDVKVLETPERIAAALAMPGGGTP